MKVGDRVRTEIALPGIPAGRHGTVTEVGRLFLVVAFEDGRHGYYARRQLTLDPLSGDDSAPDDDQVPLGVSDARVPRGSHLCLLASTSRIAVNIVSLYTAAGLTSGESVFCIVPDMWRPRLLRGLAQLKIEGETAVRRRSLVMMPPTEIYGPPCDFEARSQLERTATVVSRALDDARGPLRCFGCVGEAHTADQWWEYEERISPILKAFGTTAMCVYERGRLTPDDEQRAAVRHTHVLRDGHISVGGLRIV